MRRRIARLGPVLMIAAVLPPLPNASSAEPEPEEARLRAHVATLASPGFLGRRGEGGRKAADYLIDHFRKLGLEPLFDGSFEQIIPGKQSEPVMGRNVGAKIQGSDPKLREEWVVVSAHFDHLGTRAGVIYPGADDNASGVAMMLEVARCFVEGKEKPKRSVMFIGFDLEEVGLFGSRYFVEHSPVPLGRIALFVTADMISRALGGVCTAYVFVMGTENAPGLRPWIERAARNRPVIVGLLGSDLLLLDRSDYGPFRSRKVPYLFFSTGENPLYHSTHDLAETLDYPKFTAISRVILGVLRQAVESDQVPGWSSTPDHPFNEAETIRAVLRILLEHREALKIGSTQERIISSTLRTLDGIVARGTITPEERVKLVRVARIILLTLF